MFKTKNIIKENTIDLNSKIDFTLLDPRATVSDLEKLCDVAYKNRYYSVCVNPCNVAYVSGFIKKYYADSLKVCSVVGFPLGANKLETKMFETKEAIFDGADEIDVVINIGRAKQGDFSYIKNELSKIKKIAKKHVVKAIIETCYFDDNDIVKLCKVCMQAKVDFVKTSTGFGTMGATENVVSLIRKNIAGKCYIKAAGGIRTRAQALRLVDLGADRIGTSHVL